MPYAANIGDLTRDPIIGRMLIAPVAAKREIVKCEKAVDGAAIMFECDDAQGQAIVDIIRMKWPKHMIRCYAQIPGRKTWSRC